MVDNSKSPIYLYTIRAQPQINSEIPQLIPDYLDAPIRKLKLNDKLIKVKFKYTGIDGIKYVIENPTPLIPPRAKCPECLKSSTFAKQTRHAPGCTLAYENIHLILNKKCLTDLNQVESQRYDTLISGPIYDADDEIPFAEIVRMPGKKRESDRTGSLQLATFTFLINKKVINARLYLNDLNFEIQKIESEYIDISMNEIGTFFVDFLKSNFRMDINEYIPMITMVETRIHINSNLKIETSKNNWKSYITKEKIPLKELLPLKEESSNKTRSFVTDKSTKLTIGLRPKTVHLMLTHGTQQECRLGTTSNNCIIDEETLNPYADFVIDKVVEILKSDPQVPKKRLDKVYNVYTPNSVFTTMAGKASTANFSRGAPGGISKKRPHPYEFFGKCPPTQIFSWNGTDNISKSQQKIFGDRTVYFPDCVQTNKEDLILPFEEVTIKEFQDSINLINDNPKNKSYNPDNGRSQFLPSKTISDWMDKFINGNFYNAKTGKPKFTPKEIVSGVSSLESKTSLAEDPHSGIYKIGKQSEFLRGDNSMVLDSRVWPGIWNMSTEDVRKFANCMAKQIRIINEPEPFMNDFQIKPLYFISKFRYDKIYNVPLNSIFVKVYIKVENEKRGKATIIERDLNVLYDNVKVQPKTNSKFVEGSDFEFYAFIDGKTIISIFEIPIPIKFKPSSKIKLKSITSTKGEKEIMINDEELEFRIAFEDSPMYIQNHVTKQVTMDFFWTGTHLEYNLNTVTELEKEMVNQYKETLIETMVDRHKCSNLKKSENFYTQSSRIPFKSKIISKYGKNKWYRFKFAWFENDDCRFDDDLELYHNPTENKTRINKTKLDPSFILEPIKQINKPRDSYLESWNKFYRVAITFADFYSNHYYVN